MAKVDVIKQMLQADMIRKMLRQGRGHRVTDDMMAETTPEYLRQGYDIPLDDVSRAQRAINMGANIHPYTLRAYNDARAHVNQDGSVYVADYELDSTDLDHIYKTDPKAFAELEKLYGSDLYELEQGERYYLTPRVAEILGEEGVTKYDSTDDLLREYAPAILRSLDETYENPYNAKAAYDWNVWQNSRPMVPDGINSVEAGTTGDTISPAEFASIKRSMAAPPPSAVVRRSGALMDPRLSHLWNGMAGLAGLGVYGIQSPEVSMEEIRSYLGEP